MTEPAHAKVGPSSLSRVMVCPGSVRELQKLVETPRRASAEGSVLHDVAAQCLENALEPHEFAGKTFEYDGFTFIIDEAMADCMVPGIDWLREQPGELYIEKRVSLDPWMPGQFGTGDVGLLQQIKSDDAAYLSAAAVEELVRRALARYPAVFKRPQHLYYKPYRGVIYDWKFGAGVPVKVENNVQLKAYALGFLYTYFLPNGIVPITFRLIIEQPRNHEGGRFWEHWDISLEDLLAFGEEIRATFKRVCDPNAELVASEYGCQFCAVKDTPAGCPAYNEWMESFFDGALDDLDDEPNMTDPKLIDPARRYQIVKHSHLITKWLTKLHNDSLEAAERGEPDPGSKVVLGRRSNRYYADETAAGLILFAALGDQAFNFTLKSISQAEKELKPGKKRPGNPLALEYLNELVTQDDGRPILVPDTDPRPAFTPIEDQLAELEDLF